TGFLSERSFPAALYPPVWKDLDSMIEPSIRRLEQLSLSAMHVLFSGESGTGKSVLARWLHSISVQAGQPLVSVSCSSLSPTSWREDLLGTEQQPGWLAQAAEGTLLFEQVDELSLEMQGVLLPLVQERVYSPVGSLQRQKVQSRLVFTTQKRLDMLVQQGHFRKDLYYGLRMVELSLPPLRARRRQVLVELILSFLRGVCARKVPTRITQAAMEHLLTHPWSGNFRELKHVLASAVLFAQGEIQLEHLILPRDPESSASLPSVGFGVEHDVSLKQLEKMYIHHVLEKYNNNRKQCSEILGIGRNTLTRKLKE
ncbi:MAG: sigma 54-interacting transcriptional regulator, partial [Myxococcota bacterium]